MKALVLVAMVLSLTACGSEDGSMKSNSSVGIGGGGAGPSAPIIFDDGESVPLGTPTPTATRVTGPSHVARSQCSAAIEIELLEKPNGPQVIEVNEILKSRVYLDPQCSGPSVSVKRIRTNRTPLKIYYRSDVLGSETLFLNVNGTTSNSIQLLTYKEQFIQTQINPPTIPGFGIQLNTNWNFKGQRFLLQGNGTTLEESTLISPQFSDSILNANELANHDKLLSNLSADRIFAFNKTNVFFDNQVINATATAIIHPAAVNLSGPGQACYSTLTDVYCTRTDGTAPYTFNRINLPAGTVQDMSSRIAGLACAIVNGSIYCWKYDFIPVAVVLGGTTNTTVAVVSGQIQTNDARTTEQILNQSIICSTSSGRVACRRSATVTIDLGFSNMTTVTSSQAPQFVALQGRVDGIHFGEVRSVITPDIFKTYLPYNTFFSELYFVRQLNNNNSFTAAMGRQDNQIFAYEAEFFQALPAYNFIANLDLK